ncbi:carboxylate-amine ligase [Noviherbaspirillum aridicola]|uniref:Glutamate--cysteine ligase n=1 Tax=Noviherbaspirillum aridicola TaxID=2849687 RepID=A0ABQ4Q9L7_9BURK|nr:glutamate-cysteine ligase family protein [Noviherbaspirillum aridicola]GIZ53741.1 glutamate--cysteine ligase [Noviherbaspirillum aridicola]
MKEDDKPLPAFAGVGIELEYMIVDRETLAVRPLADRLLDREGTGGPAGGALGWSNELVLHVIEVKNLRPAASLDTLPAAFQREVDEINARLAPLGACLMPGAMHPRMDPRVETVLWPHGNEAIYRAYDRIFDSRSHGWANLQSMHVNLPFADDAQFARLHAAIRLVLPILPALAASSPLAEGRLTGWADYRMRVYCDNADDIPCIAGLVVPETVASRNEYEAAILAPMYDAIAPHDPEGVLRHEWLNSRGAIARFSRNAIEIRVIDTQECPQADLAVAAACCHAVRALYEAGEHQLARQQDIPTGALAAMLQDCMRDADQAHIDNALYLSLLGYPRAQCSAGELWRHLAGPLLDDGGPWAQALRVQLEHGPLARRLLQRLGPAPDAARIDGVYRSLCDCLRTGSLFLPC